MVVKGGERLHGVRRGVFLELGTLLGGENGGNRGPREGVSFSQFGLHAFGESIELVERDQFQLVALLDLRDLFNHHFSLGDEEVVLFSQTEFQSGLGQHFRQRQVRTQGHDQNSEQVVLELPNLHSHAKA